MIDIRTDILKKILSYYIYHIIPLSVPGADQKEGMYFEYVFNLFYDVFTWRNVREFFCKTHPEYPADLTRVPGGRDNAEGLLS